MNTIFRLVVVLAFVSTGLVSVGCSSGQFGRSTEWSDSTRFERPDLSAREAAKTLEQRLEGHQRELNVSREQLAVLEQFNRELEDSQLPVAISILNQRVEELEQNVTDLSWRLNRAVVAASEGSMEDFSMVVRAAPEAPEHPTRQSRAVLKELDSRYLQLKREIDSLALNISNAELEQSRRGELSSEATRQVNIDRSRREMLSEEYLKTEWRVQVAQIAVSHRSRLDISPLLIQPESQSASELATGE